MTTDIETQIDQALADPASVSAQGQSVTARSAADQIALLQFGAAAAASSNRRRGLRYSKCTNPGALSDAGQSPDRAFES